MNSTPPFWDLSRESWGARYEPLPFGLLLGLLWYCGRTPLCGLLLRPSLFLFYSLWYTLYM